MRTSLAAAVLVWAVGAPVSAAHAQTCVQAGCAPDCGPGFIQVRGKCLHVTAKGTRCVSESFRARLAGPPRPVGKPCTGKTDEGDSYRGVVGN